MQPDITYQNDKWQSAITGIDALIQNAVDETLSMAGFDKDAELSIVLADDDFVQVLNRDYRGKDKPTNVLSFPQLDEDMPELSLGDLILAFETIEREAGEQDKRLEDHFRHMIVHGLLHLLGYDHIDDKDAEEMEAVEIRVLAALGIKNPYEIAGFVA